MRVIGGYQIFTVVILITAFCSCKKSGSSSSDASIPAPVNQDTLAATIFSPVTLNIYPGTASGGAGRIYIKTAKVGNITVALPMLFDTGSAGVTLNALSIFPTSVVDASGFKFKTGQDTIQYNGIIITKNNVQKIYGTAAIETQEIGNLGYAKLTLGDAGGSVTTLSQPILFYYKTLEAGKLLANGSGLGNVCGVNTANNVYQGVTDTTYNLNVISPFKYLIYNKSLTPGFKIGAVSLPGCDINTAGSCAAQGLLTVGLLQTDEAAYATSQLGAISPQPALVSAKGYPGYPAYTTYNPVIINATITNTIKTKTSSVLLDSGNPGVIFNFPADSISATQNLTLTLTTPYKVSFTYNYQTASFNTIFNTSGSRSVYGISIFTKFNFLEDYQNGIIGLKAAN